MPDEPDYITVNPAVTFGQFNVVRMRYDRVSDSYFVFRVSEPVAADMARGMAIAWAASAGIEVR